MPPDALIWLTARSVLTRISAPSTAVRGALSSSTPILMGGPDACVEPPPLVPLPPQAARARTPTTAAPAARHLPPPRPALVLALLRPPPGPPTPPTPPPGCPMARVLVQRAP